MRGVCTASVYSQCVQPVCTASVYSQCVAAVSLAWCAQAEVLMGLSGMHSDAVKRVGAATQQEQVQHGTAAR
jgi:hypothetical protein